MQDDDLWSPQHQHRGQHHHAIRVEEEDNSVLSEALFLSHFLPVPNNRSLHLHPSAAQLRQTTAFVQQQAAAEPLVNTRRTAWHLSQQQQGPAFHSHQLTINPPPPPPMFNQFSSHKPASQAYAASRQFHSYQVRTQQPMAAVPPFHYQQGGRQGSPGQFPLQYDFGRVAASPEQLAQQQLFIQQQQSQQTDQHVTGLLAATQPGLVPISEQTQPAHAQRLPQRDTPAALYGNHQEVHYPVVLPHADSFASFARSSMDAGSSQPDVFGSRDMLTDPFGEPDLQATEVHQVSEGSSGHYDRLETGHYHREGGAAVAVEQQDPAGKLEGSGGQVRGQAGREAAGMEQHAVLDRRKTEWGGPIAAVTPRASTPGGTAPSPSQGMPPRCGPAVEPAPTARPNLAHTQWRATGAASANTGPSCGNVGSAESAQDRTAAAALNAAVAAARSFARDNMPRLAVPMVDVGELVFGTLIGTGGFGKVYYGEWRGQEVAIKVLSSEAGMRPSLCAEFQRELVTMSALPDHPHVLRLLAACTEPPHLAIITQYCERGSLYAMLHSPQLHLTWARIVHLVLGAARGMAHLHAAKIVHRDLKSGNLLVDGSYTVKVADFGLSRMVLDLHATLTGGLGTYQWMSPEVLAHQRYSEKADVYSFGIVLWECSARQVPYAGLNGLQAAMAVMNRGLRPEIPLHTPAPLERLIRACWAPIPDQRPGFPQIVASLEAMYEDIRAFKWEPEGIGFDTG